MVPDETDGVKLNILIVSVDLATQPSIEEIVKAIVYVPFAVYVCEGAVNVEVGVPSPQFQTVALVPEPPELLFVVEMVLEQTDEVVVNADVGME